MTCESGLSKREVEVLSGLFAGLTTTVVAHPLDLIKLRLQLSTRTGEKNTHAFRRIIRELNKESLKVDISRSQGQKYSIAIHRSHMLRIFRTYYRGLSVNILGNATAWSAYFLLYEEFKSLIPVGNATSTYFISSLLAGVGTSLLTNPIWVLKTRILSKNRNDVNAYKYIGDGIKDILFNEGLSGFWKGTIPGLFSVVQAALQFTFYDHIKDFRMKKANRERLSTTEYLLSSACSKLVSMSLTYPTQVLRARFQSNHDKTPSSIKDACISIWQNEGKWRGFYKGMFTNMFRVLPATCITFVSYESAKSFFA